MQIQNRDIKATDEWSTRLLKLLPAEATAVYLGVRQLADAAKAAEDHNVFIFAAVEALVLLAFNRYLLNMTKFVRQNLVVTASFVIWVMNIEVVRLTRGRTADFFASIGVDPRFWSAGVLAIWVAMIIPMVLNDRFWHEKRS